jgi:hypothetical protein
MVGGEGFGNALGCIYYGFIGCFVGCVILGGIHIYKWIWPKEKKIESTTIIHPTIKLTVRNNKVDTIYVYSPNE